MVNEHNFAIFVLLLIIEYLKMKKKEENKPVYVFDPVQNTIVKKDN
jgi:5'-3' exonuclease